MWGMYKQMLGRRTCHRAVLTSTRLVGLALQHVSSIPVAMCLTAKLTSVSVLSYYFGAAIHILNICS